MKIKFDVLGMTCAACSARVEKVTSKVLGVTKVEVNLLAGKMTVEAESEAVNERIIAAVSEAGYIASIPGNKSEKKLLDGQLKHMKQRILCSAIFLCVLMYFTMGHMLKLPMPHWYMDDKNAVVAALIQLFLTLPVVFLNRSYYSRGFKALWHRSSNMDSLIAVGSGASLIYGIVALFIMAYCAGHDEWNTVEHYRENLYFESAAMILTLISLGKFLETRAKGKTGDAIRRLMELSPNSATVLRDGVEKTVQIDEVRVGDVVVVRSGGNIPVDGTVVSGRASVDQSTLTGESIPVEKNPGDSVSAATISMEGYLQIRADKVGKDTTLAQVIKMVEEAGGSKAPIARLADKIAGIFVPVVMSIALCVFAVWMLIGKGIEFSLTAAIAVLVISCPCALGLATPVAIMVGTGRGAGMGVLFKTAEALENLHRIDTVVLDKTGTLTTGKPAVTDVLPEGVSEQQLLSVAASLEVRSEHPFAKAIMDRAKDVEYIEPEQFESLPGRGVSAIINSVKHYGGNKRLMESMGISVPEYKELAEQGKTPLYFAADSSYIGAIAAADVLKPDSAEAVKAMTELGLEVVMLSGDNKKTAEHIGRSIQLNHVIAEVLPGEKAGVIQSLCDQGHAVLMVGDGINDAPALACADVGMAIGAGTDIAMESADVVLMNNSLAGVVDAVTLSKATIRNIRQNLFWAFFYNCLGIPLAAFGLLNPMIGAACMSLSSVFVVSNALRLRLFKNHRLQKNAEDNQITVKEEKMMETIIMVNGMMCTHCKARVEAVCKEIPGTVDAVVDLQAKNVTVTGTASVEALKLAITNAGYEVVE